MLIIPGERHEASLQMVVTHNRCRDSMVKLGRAGKSSSSNGKFSPLWVRVTCWTLSIFHSPWTARKMREKPAVTNRCVNEWENENSVWTRNAFRRTWVDDVRWWMKRILNILIHLFGLIEKRWVTKVDFTVECQVLSFDWLRSLALLVRFRVNAFKGKSWKLSVMNINVSRFLMNFLGKKLSLGNSLRKKQQN